MTQGTLVFCKGKNLVQSKLPGAPKHRSLTQQKLPFKPILDPRKTQQDSVRRIVMKKLGTSHPLVPHPFRPLTTPRRQGNASG